MIILDFLIAPLTNTLGQYSDFGQAYPIANKFEKNHYSKLT